MKRLIIQTLILIDCILNWVLAGSINETLSARAHRMRVKHQPYWWWLADVIDAIFFWQSEHCLSSFNKERSLGGALVWLPTWMLKVVW